MPGSVLGFDDLKNKTDKNFLPSGSSTLAGETDNKKKNKYIAPKFPFKYHETREKQ